MICCPKCGWEPRASSRWYCTCGYTWNTFDTGGVCPGCVKVWEDTQCLSCGRWSPHKDWYRDEPTHESESETSEQVEPAECAPV